jgi:hypothetical protein
VEVDPGAKFETVTAAGVVKIMAPLPAKETLDVPYAFVACTVA